MADELRHPAHPVPCCPRLRPTWSVADARRCLAHRRGQERRAVPLPRSGARRVGPLHHRAGDRPVAGRRGRALPSRGPHLGVHRSQDSPPDGRPRRLLRCQPCEGSLRAVLAGYEPRTSSSSAWRSPGSPRRVSTEAQQGSMVALSGRAEGALPEGRAARSPGLAGRPARWRSPPRRNRALTASFLAAVLLAVSREIPGPAPTRTSAVSFRPRDAHRRGHRRIRHRCVRSPATVDGLLEDKM